ncbi:MAG: hypothetical protein MUE99_01685 [Chitinophagaceae bacterium]|nr:hypothetical protein [Chitinophagaceae bacterium]
MHHLIKSFIAITLLVSAACNEPSEENSSDATLSTPSVTEAPVVPPAKDSSATLNITPSAATVTAPVTSVNPPHGQPGHRCDIAVGAPLPSTNTTAPAPNPVVTQPAVINPPPAANPIPVTSGPVQGPKKVNPPHGEPGHRCDIAVGAPLN